MLASADLFSQDDEGLVVLRAEMLPDSQLAAVRRAVYDCPSSALSYLELSSPEAGR